MSKILVCPIVFNEKNKLVSVIERFLKSGSRAYTDYLIIDDGSYDGSTEIIRGYASRGVKTIKHPERLGVGNSIRTAIHYAGGQGYDILVIMAGNDKDNPNEIQRLIDPLCKKGYDFVQGSRYKGHEGAVGHMPYYRRVATRIHPWLMSLITGTRLTDSTNGFRAFKLSLFNDRRINIDQSWLDHYELEPYLFYKVVTLGYKFTEVPVTKIYPSKKLGYTKMRPFLGWWSILKPLIYLGLKIKS